MGCASSKAVDVELKETVPASLNNGDHTRINKDNDVAHTSDTRRSSATISSKEEIKLTSGKTDDIDVPTTCASFGNFTSVRFACATKRGFNPDEENSRKANQDSYCARYGHFAGCDGDAFFGVFDGHGPCGEKSSQMASERLPDLISKHVQIIKDETGVAACNELTNEAHIQAACSEAHVECDVEMHNQTDFDDKISGTTAISFYFHSNQNRVTICNVGDSRAILGTLLPGAEHLTAVPLSQDQTPKRDDEADRCRKAGARILSFSQIQPDPDDDDDDDEEDDPPRVWAPKGMYPGTAFTRSIGDAIAENLGVFAMPEMLTLDVSENERVLVLASDGVYDVLSNQCIIDICSSTNNDPAEACKIIIQKSYNEWIENVSHASDDITIICIFLGDVPQKDSKDLDESTQAEGGGRKNRIRQKTLRNLWTEDMKPQSDDNTKGAAAQEDSFFAPPPETTEVKRSNSM